MAIPHVLSAPPLIVQDPRRCWAAAYDGFTQATAAFLHVDVTPGTGDDLVRRFERARANRAGLVDAQGRATHAGVRLMGIIGMMRTRRYVGRRVRAPVIERLLDDGYIYCAYYWNSRQRGRGGHAVVIYGVDRTHILLMDPARGRGLVREPHNYFARQSSVVMLGTSLLVTLGRGLEQAFSGILASGTAR